MAPEVRGDRLLIRHPGRRAPWHARGRERLIEGGRLHPNEATANAKGALSGSHSGATERSRVSRRNSREEASSCPPSFAPRRFDRNLAPPQQHGTWSGGREASRTFAQVGNSGVGDLPRSNVSGSGIFDCAQGSPGISANLEFPRRCSGPICREPKIS